MSEEKTVEVGGGKLESMFTYVRDGEETQIKMSFGLLNILLQAIGNYNNIGLVGADPMVNDIILRKFLVKRTPGGKPLEKYKDDKGIERLLHELENVYDIDISPEDTERALFFCQCHMADFMLRSLKNAAGVQGQSQAAQTALQNSMSGLIGSLASSSTTPVAPPSETPGKS